MSGPVTTKHEDIVSYWETRELESGLSIDWCDAHERCWRCGYKSKLERCHIIPSSCGGADEPSNLVLLCGPCHEEAPNVVDPEFIWNWLRAHGTACYDTYWTLRGMAEFEFIFKRKPFSLPDVPSVQTEKMFSLTNAYVEKCTWHFGHKRLNPSTIAWVLLQVERELIAKQQRGGAGVAAERQDESH